MAEVRKLIYCFSSDDLGATARAIVEQGLTPVGFPEEVEVDMKSVSVDDEWVDTLVAGIGKRPGATWNGMVDSLTLERDCVRGLNHGYELDPPSLVRRLGRIPFTVASFATFHDWSYRSPFFGGLHYRLGWGCAFQGAGHERLVSRRWLATGPSRILRGPNDTTLVQLHDFSLGLEDAREQAQLTHADLMAGFVTYHHQFTSELAGLHKGNDRSLVFVIHGRVVSAHEMFDAAAARLLQPFGPEKPIEKVVYVFIDRAAADAQMPALWRYGHHVHLIGDDGVERRIDDTYAPRVERPAWTRGDAAEEPPAKIVLGRDGVSLHPDAVEAIRKAILAERPDFEPRLEGLTFQKSVQPFFGKHTIVYANSAVPMPARFVVLALGPAGQGQPLLLTKRIERLRAVAAADPPPDLSRLETAQAYALYGSGWTTTAVNGEMRLEAFDHIPWFELTPAQHVEVEELRAKLGARIRPEHVLRTEAGWEFRSWVIADKKLIERTLVVPLNGQLERIDLVHHEGLLVPEGKHWGTRDGRHVPVG